MEKKSSLTDLRHVGAVLLGIAIRSFFPKALVLDVKATSKGFYCDFRLSHLPSAPFLKDLEENVQVLLRNKEKVSLREMVPFSAREYFKMLGQPVLAERVGSVEGLVSLMDIGGTMLPADTLRVPDSLEAIGGVKLLQEERSCGSIRIYGAIFFRKEEIKEFCKSQWVAIGKSHVCLGEEKQLFFFQGNQCVFLPKGRELRANFLCQIESIAQQEGVHFVEAGSPAEENGCCKSHYEIFERTGLSCISENVTVCKSVSKAEFNGILFTGTFQSNFSHFFCPESLLEDRVISCLHFVTKIFKILGFAFEVFLVEKQKRQTGLLREALKKAYEESGQNVEVHVETTEIEEERIELRVEDRTGLFWPVCIIRSPRKVTKKQGLFCIPFSLFLSLERLIALDIEKSRKI